MPTLIDETDVTLTQDDLLRRVHLPRQVDPTTHLIVPPKRTPGLHLSGLIRYVAETSRITDRVKEIAAEEYPLAFAMGVAWEEFAVSLYPEIVWQPGEVDEPVIMTCDGITVHDGTGKTGFILEEFKRSRAKKKPGHLFCCDKWAWMHQGMGYCIGYQTDLVRWHVLWDMEFPQPIYTKYLVSFSVEELSNMRRMIDANKQAAIDKGYSE